MCSLTEEKISSLLEPYLAASKPSVIGGRATYTPHAALYSQLSLYLGLLLRWNARMNLTAVREPEQIVQRHFGESLFAAAVLGNRLEDGARILDFGSGAGFPGLPTQLLLPRVRVTLAESQGKKAAFLREVVRALGSQAQVWNRRVEDLPGDVCFDAVMMRAVDNSEVAREAAIARLVSGGCLAELTAAGHGAGEERLSVPGSQGGELVLYRKE